MGTAVCWPCFLHAANADAGERRKSHSPNLQLRGTVLIREDVMVERLSEGEVDKPSVSFSTCSFPDFHLRFAFVVRNVLNTETDEQESLFLACSDENELVEWMRLLSRAGPVSHQPPVRIQLVWLMLHTHLDYIFDGSVKRRGPPKADCPNYSEYFRLLWYSGLISTHFVTFMVVNRNAWGKVDLLS